MPSPAGQCVETQPAPPIHVRVLAHRVLRDQATHARAHHVRVGAVRQRAIRRVDEGLQFLHQEREVAVGDDFLGLHVVRARHVEVDLALHGALRHVLFAPLRRVPDADDDGFAHGPFLDQVRHHLVDGPVDAAIRRRGIEEVLPVVHVQNRVALAGILAVAGRQPHVDVARCDVRRGHVRVPHQRAGNARTSQRGRGRHFTGEHERMRRHERGGQQGPCCSRHPVTSLQFQDRG